MLFYQFLIAFAVAAPTSPQTVNLKASDGTVVSFDPAVLGMSSLVANLADEASEDSDTDMEGNGEEYILPSVSGSMLKKISEYVTYHKNDAEMTHQEMRDAPISHW
jgi:ribosomal protein L30/L7E